MTTELAARTPSKRRKTFLGLSDRNLNHNRVEDRYLAGVITLRSNRIVTGLVCLDDRIGVV